MGARKKKRVGPLLIILIIVLLAAAAYLIVRAADEAAHQIKLAEHPIKYSEFVEKYADEYGIDKYIVYALIKTESGFDHNAVSETGARGLTQIMEETFDWIKFRLGDGDDITYDDMFDPEMNIRYGAYLMDYLIDRFGSLDTAAAAYFSGVGTVSGWLADERYSRDGTTLSEIPSRSAAHYVNKINKALDTYNELYRAAQAQKG